MQSGSAVTAEAGRYGTGPEFGVSIYVYYIILCYTILYVIYTIILDAVLLYYIIVPSILLAHNLPTKIIPAKIAWRKHSGKFPLDMRIPPLEAKALLESDPLKSRLLVQRLAAEYRTVMALPT